MDCPVCKEPMIVLELEEVEIDYCTSCEGIWLDAGELERLLGDSREKEDFLSSLTEDRGISEKPRRCPVCRKRMKKVQVGKQTRVRIDRCRKDHGIWLDGGELEAILKMSNFGAHHRVLDVLKGVFAKRTS